MTKHLKVCGLKVLFFGIFLYGGAGGFLRAQSAVPKSILRSASVIELNYINNSSFSIDPEALFLIALSPGAAACFVIKTADGVSVGGTGVQGNAVYQIENRGAQNACSGTITLRGNGGAYTGREEVITVRRETPYIEILDKDNNRVAFCNSGVSSPATLQTFVFEEPDADWRLGAARFPAKLLKISSNISVQATITFTPDAAILPWLYFSKTRDVFLPASDRIEQETDIMITQLNYARTKENAVAATKRTSERKATVTVASAPGILVPCAAGAQFVVKQSPVLSLIQGVDGVDGALFSYKPYQNPNNLMPGVSTFPYTDTIQIPYYLSEGVAAVQSWPVTAQGWGILNDVAVAQQLGVQLQRAGADRLQLRVIRPNYSRAARQMDLILVQEKGIIFTPPHVFQKVVLVQKPGYIDIGQDTVIIETPEAGATAQISALSNLTYKCLPPAVDWLSVDERDKTGDAQITVTTTAANYSGRDRRTLLTINSTDGRGPERKVVLIQKAAYIRVRTPRRVIFAREKTEEEVAVAVTANIPWTVQMAEAVDWAEITEIGADSFKVRVLQDNLTGRDRTAGIIFRPEDGRVLVQPPFLEDEDKDLAKYILQLDKDIFLSLIPYPTLVFNRQAGLERTLNVLSKGVWRLELPPGTPMPDWLSFPNNFSSERNETLVFRTLSENNTNQIRRTRVQVRSQISALPPKVLEVIQTTDLAFTVNTLVQDKLQLRVSHFEAGFKAAIYNETGVMVKRFALTSDRMSVPVSDLSAGNFVIYFYDKDGRVLEVKKFIKI